MEDNVSDRTKQIVHVNEEFFADHALNVAPKLLGKLIRRVIDDEEYIGRIVEVEAYTQDDPSCHAYKGMTERNKILFGPPGYTYVYFTYGCHHCLNLVTGYEGRAEGVLIRALQPVSGIEYMKRNRNKKHLRDLCSGPGKLAQALRINLKDCGQLLGDDRFSVIDDGYVPQNIVRTGRIGISVAKDYPWRFYIDELKEWVSR